jgi:hypothetical protein
LSSILFSILLFIFRNLQVAYYCEEEIKSNRAVAFLRVGFSTGDHLCRVARGQN